MATVFIKKTTYAYDDLQPVVFDLLAQLGSRGLTAGSRILVKPNLLMPAAPETAITTHPLVVKAVVAYLNQNGGKPLIADSPPVGGFHRFMKKGGYAEALAGLDYAMRPLRETVTVDIGEPFGRIDLAAEAVQADVIINLAKLKTHTMMGLTLGVKNMFGCVIGLEKPKWHLRAGADRALFARLLLQIHDVLAPAVTLVDGVLAMEGQGPGKSGTPRVLSRMVGGDDAVAVDMAVCKLLGLDPARLPTHQAAMQRERVPPAVHIQGEVDMLSDFVFPELDEAATGLRFWQRVLRKRLIQRPVVDNRACKLCGECWQYCPAKAIRHSIRGISFDYDACIRCYCCLEICPYGAISARRPLLGRMVDRARCGGFSATGRGGFRNADG